MNEGSLFNTLTYDESIMTVIAEHLSKTAADTLCKKGQQMQHMEEALNWVTLAQNVSPDCSWVPMMRAGRPAPAAGFVPHRSPVMGLPPITGEWPRPMPGGKVSCM